MISLDKKEDYILKQMYEILISNLFITYPDLEKDKHDNKENCLKWINMIKSNNDYHVVVYEENNKVIGYLNYMVIENKMWICETQVKDKNKKTLKKLITYYVKLKDVSTYDKVTIHINSNNILSQKIFTHIGFKLINNTLYEISMKDLTKWCEK